MIEIFDCEQGSEEWFTARLGIPTASEFSTVMAQGRKKGDPSLTRLTYMRKLAGEIITGTPMENYSNQNMERGKALEAEARELYQFATDTELHQVGFIKHVEKTCGASPDSLIGEDGGLEIKTAFPHILIGYLLRDEFPPEHVAQTQGTLLVTGRKWWDLAVYWPGLPLFRKRAHRDEDYIAELSRGIADFNMEKIEIVARVRNYQAAA